MIQNKRELLAKANEWVIMAKNDLRDQIVAFMREMGTDATTLADALGISEGELDQILNGNGEITLTTFAKILIATDNAIEIKPITSTPWGGYDAMARNARPTPPMGNPRMSRRPMPPMGGMVPPMGNRIPPIGETAPRRFCGMPGIKGNRPTPPMGNPRMSRRPMPPVGGMMPPMEGMPSMETMSALDAMPRTALVQTIQDNDWDTEIDVACASRADLIDFLIEKGFNIETPAVCDTTCDAPINESAPTSESAPTETTSDTSDRLAQMLAEELRRNPALKSVVEQYL